MHVKSYSFGIPHVSACRYVPLQSLSEVFWKFDLDRFFFGKLTFFWGKKKRSSIASSQLPMIFAYLPGIPNIEAFRNAYYLPYFHLWVTWKKFAAAPQDRKDRYKQKWRRVLSFKFECPVELFSQALKKSGFKFETPAKPILLTFYNWQLKGTRGQGQCAKTCYMSTYMIFHYKNDLLIFYKTKKVWLTMTVKLKTLLFRWSTAFYSHHCGKVSW